MKTASDSPPPVHRIVEALFFVGGDPLTPERAGEIVRGLGPEQFHEALHQLNTAYRRQARPYEIRPQGNGFVLALRPSHRHVADAVRLGTREARLSTAAIDVLSLVAYRQPISRADVDSLRGANSAAILRQLVRRGLVQLEVDANEKKSGGYRTTPRFLELFGLQNLDDLPRPQDTNPP